MIVLTTREAAQYLKCSTQTLIDWINEGVEIPHRRLGKGKRPEYRFAQELLDEFILNGCVSKIEVDPRTIHRKTKEKANGQSQSEVKKAY